MIYRRRHPERTDYYRIIEANFEEFERTYADIFEADYGYLRTEVMKTIYAYLDCGIPENGVARVRCECGEDFFVAFSCKKRVICPSCSTKRSILFGEKIREIVKPFSHVHMTFTIPKILRIFFKRNRKLLQLLVQSANFAIEKYFRKALGIEDGYAGGIFCIQSQGSLLNYHPHVHALILAGIIKDGKFYEQINISTEVIAKIFRARLLAVLLEQGIIRQELIDLLMSWNHNSGFNVHSKGKINGSDGDAIEKVARYMSRATISVERVAFNPDDNTVTVYEKQDRSPSCKQARYTLLEFIALLAGHIPSPYECITLYYGVYSSSYRGKEKRETIDGAAAVKVEEAKGKGKASSTWARLIQKIFEIGPLLCPKCGKEMKLIAFITEYSETKKILKHIGEETQRAPPLSPTTISANETDGWYGDYIPSDDVYFHDEEYVY